MTQRLPSFKYRIIFDRGKFKGSAIHTFYAPDQATADRYAKAWGARRSAAKLTRIRKDGK